MLLASVAPDVNSTSRAAAPTSSATCSRARSSTARAAAPSACVLDGLPQRSRSAAAIASTTSGRTGVVAL